MGSVSLAIWLGLAALLDDPVQFTSNAQTGEGWVGNDVRPFPGAMGNPPTVLEVTDGYEIQLHPILDTLLACHRPQFSPVGVSGKSGLHHRACVGTNLV